MFGGAGGFEDDPFFDLHRAHMERMNSMMLNPFGMMNEPLMAVTDGREQQRDHQRRGRRSRNQQEIARRDDPFGGTDIFGDMFGNMNRMMSNMRSMMDNVNTQMQNPQVSGGPNSNFYSQSSVMTYSNDGRGQPKVYQATTSTRQSGGVKETRKSVKDSEKGLEKMAIGRHIGDRSHVITKQRNKRTGAVEENQDLVNLDEDDVEHFDQEWRHKTRTSQSGPSRGHRSVDRPRRHTPAITHRHTEY